LSVQKKYFNFTGRKTVVYSLQTHFRPAFQHIKLKPFAGLPYRAKSKTTAKTYDDNNRLKSLSRADSVDLPDFINTKYFFVGIKKHINLPPLLNHLKKRL